MTIKLFMNAWPFLACIGGSVSSNGGGGDAVVYSAVEDKCLYSPDIVQLQDGTTSFLKFAEEMSSHGEQLYGDLKKTYPSLRFGIASFGDKPTPMRGRGFYGRTVTRGVEDKCYEKRASLDHKGGELNKAFMAIRRAEWSGGDLQEDVFGGMFNAATDPEMKWTPPEDKVRDGAAVARIMIVVTDEIPQATGEAWGGVVAWNYPIRRVRGPQGVEKYKETAGGFGAWDFQRTGGINGLYFKSNTWDIGINPNVWGGREKEVRADMVSMATIKLKILDKETLTDADEVEWKRLVDYYGPEKWEIKDASGKVLPKFIPLDEDHKHCNSTEFVTQTKLGEILKKKKIYPIFLIANRTDGARSRPLSKYCDAFNQNKPQSERLSKFNCLMNFYKSALKSWDIRGHVAEISYIESEATKSIKRVVKELTDGLCIKPTKKPILLPSRPTDSTDSTSESTKLKPPVLPSGSTKATDSTIPLVPVVPNKKSTTVKVGSSDSTTLMDRGSTTLTKDGCDCSHTCPEGTDCTCDCGNVQPEVVPEEKKTPVAAIAGATAGAVGAAGAVAAAAYAKMSGGLFGGPSGAEAADVTQVQAPDNPVERETMEEVTIDMFS